MVAHLHLSGLCTCRDVAIGQAGAPRLQHEVGINGVERIGKVLPRLRERDDLVRKPSMHPRGHVEVLSRRAPAGGPQHEIEAIP